MQNHLYLYPNLVSTRKATCTQKELAEKIGIAQQEISRYERGEIKAPINFIADVADICGVSVDYVLGREKNTTYLLSHEENEIICIYRKMSGTNKIRLKERAETLLEMQKSEE